MHITIVGAGLIGQAWAIVFARAGHQVRLWDGIPDTLPQSMELISQQLQTLHSKGLISAHAAVLDAITPVTHLEEALEGALYVQENLPERLNIKADIFAQLDAMTAPDTILASSTSSIPASAFTESLTGRHRCLVAHPVNPPYLIPVVEICAAPWTDEATIMKTRQLMQDIKQKPVIVRGEPRGFILNRLQGAMLREAFRLVEGGHISAEDLDITVKDGLGLRWCFMGPFETIDLNAPGGLKDYCERYGEMYRDISEEQTSTESWSPELIQTIHAQRRDTLPENALEERRFWRDDRLMELALHKHSEQE